MAQFSSVAGIAEMNSTLKAISDKLDGGSTSDALSYVGRTVLTPDNVAYGRTDGGIARPVELADDATDLVVPLAKSAAEVLTSLSLAQPATAPPALPWTATPTNRPA